MLTKSSKNFMLNVLVERRHKSIKFVQILMFFQALVLVFKSSNLSIKEIYLYVLGMTLNWTI